MGQLVRSQFIKINEEGMFNGKTSKENEALNILILGGSQVQKYLVKNYLKNFFLW